jgi:hypothetical protein
MPIHGYGLRKHSLEMRGHQYYSKSGLHAEVLPDVSDQLHRQLCDTRGTCTNWCPAGEHVHATRCVSLAHMTALDKMTRQMTEHMTG